MNRANFPHDLFKFQISMKTYLFVIPFCLCASLAFGQTQIGLKLSPALSVNRVQSDSESQHFSANGAGGRISFGPILDLFLRDNYYFSTGLLYTPKRAGVSATRNGVKIEEAYSLQYLQIPATLKLFTNEVALDKRLYFQVGGLTEIKVNEKDGQGDILVDKFRFFDFSLVCGVGLEYRLGVDTSIFGGLSYNRGLFNAASKQSGDYDDFRLKNDMLMLDFGVKF